MATLEAWEYPKKSGIKIRVRINRAKKDGDVSCSYRVSIPQKLSNKLKAEIKQFPTKEKAEEWALEQRDKYRDYGTKARELTPKQRMEAIQAIEKLDGTGFDLSKIVDNYLHLLGKCARAGLDLSQVVEFGLSRLRPAGGTKTLGDIAQELNDLKKSIDNLSERTIKDFKDRSTKISKRFGKTLIHDISKEDLVTWIKSLDRASRTKQNYLMTLREIFKYSLQKKYIAENPLDELNQYDIKLLLGMQSTEVKQPHIMTVSEAEKLIIAAFEHPEINLQAAVTLGLFAGIRTEELKKLHWEDVHLEDEIPFVKISEKIAKKRRIRNVDLPANAVMWLSKCKNRNGILAGNKHANDYQKRFQKLQVYAGFRFQEVHDGKKKWVTTWKENYMRHSFGSYHYALFGDSMTTSRLMGHKEGDGVFFDHYRHLAKKQEAEKYFEIKPKESNAKVVEFAS